MLVFEKSRPGRGVSAIPKCDVDVLTPPDKDLRKAELHLPEIRNLRTRPTASMTDSIRWAPAP